MKYTKPALTYEQQADLLIARGLVASKSDLIDRLRSVNYYRLSGYLFPFRKPDDTYKPNTTLELIWNRYTFDRRLRLIIMDPIERFETSIRTTSIYLHAHKHGPFGYINPATLPKLSPDDFGKFYKTINDEFLRSKEVFVKHFKDAYGDSHADLPIWMAGELMSFGTLFTFYRGLTNQDKQSIADTLGIQHVVLDSWFKCLNMVRNICAHHSRLWNRELGIKPLIPDKMPEWHAPISIPNNKVFGVLSICIYMLNRVAPNSQWKQRLKDLLAEYPLIPLNEMGFINDWEKHSIWR